LLYVRPAILVEDDDDVMSSLCDALEEAGYDCWLTHRADAAVERLRMEEHAPDLILLDMRLPGRPPPSCCRC
jgi:DNA-binding response OmpR family regulator